MSAQQPPWHLPDSQRPDPVLKVYNSLTRTKASSSSHVLILLSTSRFQTEFVPQNGRHVKWYNCGPTVYDASHMGHARNYVTQDILRRIISDYFGYDVHFVMNVTDIDDKARDPWFIIASINLTRGSSQIILRARQNHLFEKFRSDTKALTPELLSTIQDAWAVYVHEKVSKGLAESDKIPKGEEVAKWLQVAQLSQDKQWKQECSKRDEKFDMHISAATLTYNALETARKSLDQGLQGSEPAHRLLNDAKDVISPVLDKQQGSSVTDHSIFRSTAAYWEEQFFNDMDRLRVRPPDTLTRVTEYVPEIVSFVEGIVKNGFAYENLGAQGIENFWKKAKAYHNCDPWVNYFLHTGHLHIEGLKMSKSLKNFITIDEILQRYSARQLRLAFLTQQWNSKVDFSESTMTGEVRNIENTFNNFFTVVKALISQARADGRKSDGFHHYETPESDLTASFHEAQTAFREALCDSFNTPSAVDVLRDVVSKTNVYINSRGKGLNVDLVDYVARWVGQMLRMFGLGEGGSSEIGWGQETKDGESTNRDETLMPYLRVLSTFRDGVRKLAIDKGDSALKDILALCDKLRDSDLVPLGVALDDQEGFDVSPRYGKALVKLVPPAELIRARDEKRAIAEAKAAKKAAAVEAERQKRIQKLEKGRVPPELMFKPPNTPDGAYSNWDDRGVPLADGEGKELSKNQAKKVLKEWTDRQKLHAEFLAWQSEQSK
ncbi:hypothetical protein ONZ45_g15017 [Pleurotus djamor]|nr:hypothetical protein ONZ45_g15017 [Pleurotus djamor]